MHCTVKLIYDNEAQVWITESNDIPGLFLESESFDDLIKKVRTATPELLLLNNNYNGPIDINFKTEHIST